jgi:hypothetical protein
LETFLESRSTNLLILLYLETFWKVSYNHKILFLLCYFSADYSHSMVPGGFDVTS